MRNLGGLCGACDNCGVSVPRGACANYGARAARGARVPRGACAPRNPRVPLVLLANMRAHETSQPLVCSDQKVPLVWTYVNYYYVYVIYQDNRWVGTWRDV